MSTRPVHELCQGLHSAARGRERDALTSGMATSALGLLAIVSAYGFALALMTKDVGIAADLVAEHAPAATLIPAVRELYNAGLAELGDDEDYTGIVKRLERQVGVELEG